MLTLLVLTDFSPVADHALRYAAALAAPAGAHLVLLHVRPSLLSSRAFTAPHSDLSETQANDLLQQRLRALPAGLRSSCALEKGDVEGELAAAARRHRASLVVVGRPDLSDMPPAVTHTTSVEVLRQVPCPLLVVPINAQGQVPPRQVLLAVDDEPLPSSRATATLQPLLGQAALTITSIAQAENANVAERALANAQGAGLTEGFTGVQARSFFHPEPAAGIAEATAALHPDLLMLVARRRSFLGALFHDSVTTSVVQDATLPVLVLPESAQ
jgi:nucleotide-binding universal stress UspA family protein